MERQIHGFNYEQKIVNENNLVKTTNYTDKWDTFEGETPASIKCIGVKASIDFGDFKYQIDAFNRTILTYKILKGKVFVLDFCKLSILFICFSFIQCSKPIIKEKKTIVIQHSFNRHCMSRCDAG